MTCSDWQGDFFLHLSLLGIFWLKNLVEKTKIIVVRKGEHEQQIREEKDKKGKIIRSNSKG
jgi:hypothetical protein